MRQIKARRLQYEIQRVQGENWSKIVPRRGRAWKIKIPFKRWLTSVNFGDERSQWECQSAEKQPATSFEQKGYSVWFAGTANLDGQIFAGIAKCINRGHTAVIHREVLDYDSTRSPRVNTKCKAFSFALVIRSNRRAINENVTAVSTKQKDNIEKTV